VHRCRIGVAALVVMMKVRSPDRAQPKEQQMSQVIARMSMSLDGYVADPGCGVAEVFDWYPVALERRPPRRALCRPGGGPAATIRLDQGA
jgi:hypothetical protein